MIYPQGFKKCYGYCKKVLPISSFYKNTDRCIECSKKHVSKYAQKYHKNYLSGGKYHQQALARLSIRTALKQGKMQKGECFMKDNTCFGRIEAHHYLGYEKEHYRDIQWICKKHHQEIDETKWGRHRVI